MPISYEFDRGVATPIFYFSVRRIVQYFYDTLWVNKITPCCSTESESRFTLVVSGFGPYPRLVHDDAPTKRAGVILTPWVMPLTLGLGTILLGGEWHVPPPPPRKCHFSISCLGVILSCLLH